MLLETLCDHSTAVTLACLRLLTMPRSPLLHRRRISRNGVERVAWTKSSRKSFSLPRMGAFLKFTRCEKQKKIFVDNGEETDV